MVWISGAQVLVVEKKLLEIRGSWEDFYELHSWYRKKNVRSLQQQMRNREEVEEQPNR